MTDPSSKYRMAGIGELLWDLLPDGKQLGGSPMNVVYHCQAAGIDSVVVSAVGNDLPGHEIIDLVKDKGQTNRTVNALSVRIGLSIVAIIVIMIAGATGVIQLNPSPLSSRASIQQAPEKVDQTTVEPVKPRAGGGRRPIENGS